MGSVKTSDDLEPRASDASGRRVSAGAAEGNQAEIEHLRHQLREKDKLIAVYRERLGSPVFLLKATAWSVVHLIPAEPEQPTGRHGRTEHNVALATNGA